MTCSGCLNGSLCCFTLLDIPAGKDNFTGVKPDEVLGGFEAEPGICAGDNDDFVLEILGGLGNPCEELVVEKANDPRDHDVDFLSNRLKRSW